MDWTNNLTPSSFSISIRVSFLFLLYFLNTEHIISILHAAMETNIINYYTIYIYIYEALFIEKSDMNAFIKRRRYRREFLS